MTPPVTRRAGRRAAAGVAALAVTAGAMLLGAGTADAAATPVTCTLLGGSLTEPVSVRPDEQVQLVLYVPLLGTRVDVGPAQSVGSQPGELLLQETVTGVVGLVGQVCQAVVLVESTATSVVPLPPVTVPTLPTLPGVPSETLSVPLPGAQIGVDVDGDQVAPPDGTDPGTGTPPPGEQPPGGTPGGTQPPAGSIGWRFDRARIPLFDFSSVPFGVGYRFGTGAAPAFRYGQRVDGYHPQFGILPDNDELTRVGTVEALPAGGARVALPVLLAVLMLGAVTGGLVRTWVLRRP